jgi:uncharacterized membrane protein YcaP (DUF421 family)
MEIQIDQEVIDTVCNSLRASKQSLVRQMCQATDDNKKDIITCQLADVNKALEVFQYLES